MALTEKLTAVADAIRDKTGKTEEMTLDQMAKEIAGIETESGGITIDDIASKLITGDIILTTERIERYAFAYHRYITSVSAANAKAVENNAFNGCQGVEEVYLPKVETVGQSAFYACDALKELALPSVWRLDYGSLAAGNTTVLEKIDIGPGVSKTSGNAFGGCKVLTTLILRRTEGIVALSNVNDFTKTPFASDGTGGTVYVPSALIETYKTATNWSTLYAAGTCNFVAIEGSEYE